MRSLYMRLKFLRLTPFFTAILLLFSSYAHSAELDVDWGIIEDPRIREALFDLYEDNFFSGIIRLVTNRTYSDLAGEQDKA